VRPIPSASLYTRRKSFFGLKIKMAAYSTKRMLFSQLFAVLVLNPSTRSTRAFHLYNRGIYSWSMKTLLFSRENNELELGVNINQTFQLVIVFLSLHKLLTHKMLLSMFTVFTVKVQLDTFFHKICCTLHEKLWKERERKDSSQREASRKRCSLSSNSPPSPFCAWDSSISSVPCRCASLDWELFCYFTVQYHMFSLV